MDNQPAYPLLVLLVDDDVAVQQMIRALLRRHDIEVDVAGDGEAALSSIRLHNYDVILLDLMLPRTDGFEVIRHLKSDNPALLSRVIVLTAAAERTLESFPHHDVRKLLRKPFDITELVSEVLACGAQQPRARAAV